MALLNDKEPRVRYLTVFALRSLGPVASEALPSLIKCLDDPDFTIRDDAIASLGTIHEQPGRIVPIITNFLEKNRSNLILRGDAIRSLGSFGADAKAAVPMISGFLNDNNEEVRSEASNALGRIDPTFARKAAVQ
jgi:HEAT repeat protein